MDGVARTRAPCGPRTCLGSTAIGLPWAPGAVRVAMIPGDHDHDLQGCGAHNAFLTRCDPFLVPMVSVLTGVIPGSVRHKER
jgi:hypothetical protein